MVIGCVVVGLVAGASRASAKEDCENDPPNHGGQFGGGGGGGGGGGVVLVGAAAALVLVPPTAVCLGLFNVEPFLRKLEGVLYTAGPGKDVRILWVIIPFAYDGGLAKPVSVV